MASQKTGRCHISQMENRMNARKPKVSVITATYNDRENLRRIIRQVVSQSYDNIEYIIVDGGSTDGTLEVIQEAKEQFGNRLLWISEPDKGIYDALNKGIRMATGEILGCCFDEYSGPDVIAKMNRMRAAVRTDTPTRSSCFQRCDCGSSMPRRGVGASQRQRPPMGMARMATNQNTQDQLANWTKMAPIIRPRTLPIAPQPPKTPMAPSKQT